MSAAAGSLAERRPRTAGLLRVAAAPAASSRMARELLACASAAALLAVLMCSGHILHGGFYYDDWSLAALARFSAPGGLLHGLWLDYGQRPGQVAYYALLDRAFGLQAAPRLALAAAMLVLEVTCLYALLRQLGLAARDALAMAALTLLFPFSDSVWLWGVLSLTSLAVAAALLGLTLALRALQSSGVRALALHGASLLLFIASICSYEVFAVAGCLAGLLYASVVGFRRARARWAADVVAIVLTLGLARAVLPIDVATPSRTEPLAGMVAHAGLIAAAGARLIGAAALPIAGVSPWLGCCLLAAALAAAALQALRLAAGDPARAELRRWLGLAGAGVLVASASWAVYVPATDHYAPSTAGTVNRVNAAAAIGVAILIYSCLMLLMRTFAQLAHLPRRTAQLGVIAAALLLGGAYLGRAAGDARAWDAAAADQRRLLGDLHAALPRLAPGAAVFVLGAPLSVGPGVPVLNTPLDLSSAMRISYSSPQLLGVPLARGASVACGPRGPLAGAFAGAYGESYLLNVGAGGPSAPRLVRLLGRAQCASAVR